MKVQGLVLAVSLLATCVNAQAVDSLPAAAFDGAWTVRIHCPSNTEESGAKGYKYDFPATVKSGFLTGRHGEEGTAGSLRIEGQILPDGEATLLAHGRTGNPDYAAKKPASGSAYSYTIKAHFEPTKGTGTRVEARVCNFTFSR